MLVFDQFEELFTLGTRDEAAQQKYEMFFTELSDLVENHPPARVRERLRTNPEQVANLDFGPAHVRVLFSLREDYLATLETYSELIPSISRNRMRLTRMNGQQALDAVILPGVELVSREVGEQIVRFVAAAGQRRARADGAGSRGRGLQELDVEPALLSLFCRELNGQRIAQGLPQITADLVEKSSDQILQNYYEGCFAGQAGGVRIFVEEELLTRDGHRDDIELQRATEVLKERGAAATCLEKLIDRRLLHLTRRGETLRVELTHDVLTGVVRDSRNERRQREAHEKAEARQREAEAMLLRRAEAERKAKEDAEASAREAAERAAVLDAALQKETRARKEADLARRRARWLAVAAVLVALIAVAAFAAALAAWSTTRAAKERAVASKKAADELIRFMQYDLRETLGKLGHLKMMGAINSRVMKYYEDHPPQAGDVQALRERGVALQQQGDLLLAEGDLAGALKSHSQGLDIAEKLAKQDPSNTDWQHDLSLRYDNVGEVLSAQGDLAGALKNRRQSLDIAEKLAKQDPLNTNWQHDLSGGYDNVGEVLRALGDLAGALKSHRQSLDIAEKLAKQDPTNTDWQADLAVVYDNVGEVLSAQGDLAGALKSHRDSLAIDEKLTKQDPNNTDWQHDLSLCYDNVGKVLSAQGDLAGALKSHRQSLDIAEKLAKQDPSNTDWQHDLSVGYNNVGEVLSAQGDLAGALKNHRQSLDIAEKLAKQDPSNVDWQADLAFFYWRTGTTLARLDSQSQKEARSMIEKGRDILSQLKERTSLGVTQQSWLDSIEADLQKMQDKK